MLVAPFIAQMHDGEGNDGRDPSGRGRTNIDPRVRPGLPCDDRPVLGAGGNTVSFSRRQGG